MKKFIKSLFESLNNDVSYAVLRGYEELPDKLLGHDIDIIIEHFDYDRVKLLLGELVRSGDYSIIMHNKTDRFATVVVAKRVLDKLEFLYLDFFFNFSLFGVEFLKASDVLNDKVFNGKLFHVSIVDEFLEKYLNTRLLGHQYPKKYQYVLDLINEEKSELLAERLKHIFGSNYVTLKNIENSSRYKLLCLGVRQSFLRQPIGQLASFLKFISSYVRNWIKPNGFSMSFTGPDGSGKTTIITSIQNSFAEIYREVELRHFRPNVIPRIAEIFNKLGLKKEVDVEYDKPHRGGETGKFSSIIRLFYYIFDYILGYFKVIKPIINRRGVLIFDRYFSDVISDSRRSKIGLNYRHVFIFRKLVPRLNYNFIFYVDPHVILERKQELTIEQITMIYEKLNYICDNDEMYFKVDNNDKAQFAINTIVDYILKGQNEKYISGFIS